MIALSCTLRYIYGLLPSTTCRFCSPPPPVILAVSLLRTSLYIPLKWWAWKLWIDSRSDSLSGSGWRFIRPWVNIRPLFECCSIIQSLERMNLYDYCKVWPKNNKKELKKKQFHCIPHYSVKSTLGKIFFWDAYCLNAHHMTWQLF